MGSRKNYNYKKGSAGKSDITLIMESGTQQLSEIQLSVKNKVEEEYNKFKKKLAESINKKNGEIIEQGSHITVYEIDCTPNFPTHKDLTTTINAGLIKATPTSSLLATSQPNVPPVISNNNVLLPNANVASSGSTVFTGQPTTYQLVMGPRMGLIVTPSNPAAVSTIASPTNVSPTPAVTTVRTTATSRIQVRPGLTNVPQPTVKRLPAPSVPVSVPKISVNPATQKNNAVLTKGPVSGTTSTVNTRSKGKLNTRQLESSPAEPTSTNTFSKNSSNSNAFVDLTDDDGKPVADSKEVSFNKYPGKIFPSLVVVARPHLKIKEMTSPMITAERTQLDTKVKGILTNSPTKFTEWLIQQGLVRSEQVCSLHVNIDMTPIKLKLGMYSDVNKFPYSGGYVWISDCCPQKFVSVFCNSIFEGAPHAPTILLKLMYHWSCQTNVHNIISWVKVENLYIKNFFTNLRAVCTAAVCEKFGKMGGVGKKIEVGVISLGTTSQNGSVRQVKVEVLGIMDPVTKFVRLRAVDPVQNAEKNHKLRFSRILESLEQWVHKGTTIITDYTVDKSTLNDLGFHSVVQVQLNSSQNKENNQAIMDYLKRVVPRMFQNTLSLLSRSIIQQFLDELVWRERWGFIPSRAFENLILHLSEMTKLDTGETLINRLKNITSNPFKDWSYKNWKINCTSASQLKRTAQALESADTDTTNKPASTGTQKTLRSKSVTGSSSATKSSVQGTSKASAKTNSSMALTIGDSSDEIATVPSLDNLPPSVTDVDDDNVSVSSNSSRRSSRNRNTNEDSKLGANGVGKWLTDTVPVLKSLETFYYGVLPPDVVVVSKLKKVDLNMKCFVCGLTYNNNIMFMKHLAGHAQNEGAFTTDFQCRYCLKNLTTAYDLEDHLGSTHFPNKYNSMCLICGERFKFRAALITHMQNIHVELELPYNCTICKYRTSEHTKAVDHFYEVHDGGERVQCPFCLKVVALESSTKTKLTQNVNFFFNHIKRHQQKRKCPKCILSFVNKALLKEHLMKDHHSCIALPGIVRHQFMEMETLLMPLPSATPNRKGKSVQLFFPNFSTYKIENHLYYPETSPAKCLECKTEVSVNQHFTSYLTCMKCMFASCCKTVMVKHVDKFHEIKGRRRQPQRKTIPLQKPLYCVCGFSSACGNSMASHLVQCKRRIAYPNPERAAQYCVQMQSASFPALVNLDDVEQDPNDASNKWLRAFVKNAATSETDDSKAKRMAISEKSPPRMLRELGLVRTETNSGDDDNAPVNAPDSYNDSAETIKPALMETDDDCMENLNEDSIKKPENEDPDKLVEVSKNDASKSSSEAECDAEEPEKEGTSSDKNNENNNLDTASLAKEPDDTIAISDTEDTNLEATKKPKSPEKDNAVAISNTDDIVATSDKEDANLMSNKDDIVATSEKEDANSTSNKGDVVANDTDAPNEDSSLVDKESVSNAATEDQAEVVAEKEQIVKTDENKEDDGIVGTRYETQKIIEDTSRAKENMEQLEAEPITTLKKESDETRVENSKDMKSATREITKTGDEMCDESAEMETEEQSPVNERMDDTEENTVAMDCEENVDETNKMVVDTDSTQDAMVVD